MQRAENLFGIVQRVCVAVLLLVLFGLQGCKTHEDAVAASEQMAQTAVTLQQYYATLDGLVGRTVEVRRAQRYLLHGPPDPASEDRLLLRHTELAKRAAIAGEIARLSALFGEITSSDAANEAAKDAEDLRKQVVGMKLLSDNSAMQQALQAAVTSLVNLVRAHDEVKAAQALAPVLVALSNFFDSEKPVYMAVVTDYYTVAAANAVVLIDKDQVAVISQYRSSMEPFGLSGEINLPELKSAARDDLKAGVTGRLPLLIQASSDATDALGDALHRMQDRVETVAKGGALRVRLPPLSLEAVKAWVAEFQTLSGVTI